ncbi:MAG: divergent PAP2 family protein [Lachnospiraceae bacterium]|nr:divergent PAP2 family protein [Lachnospiraceae bacterium]
MNILLELLSNRILITGICGWLVAQVLKTIIYTVVNKSFRLERMVGDGGMPSAHSATVTSVAVSIGLFGSFSSPEFAVAAIIAIVVMHDAMGVRLETGKQAIVINDIIEMLNQLGDETIEPDVRLKEFVGHTPMQVAAGFLLGILVAVVSFYFSGK